MDDNHKIRHWQSNHVICDLNDHETYWNFHKWDDIHKIKINKKLSVKVSSKSDLKKN